MTDKEFKRLNRAELIEIIYQLQIREIELVDRLEEVERQLADRRIKIEQSGSIAEAALKINGLFQAADQAANQYLEEIKQSVLETTERREAILDQAKRQAQEIIRLAQESVEP